MGYLDSSLVVKLIIVKEPYYYEIEKRENVLLSIHSLRMKEVEESLEKCIASMPV